MLGAASLLLIFARPIRIGEAWLQTMLLRVFDLHSEHVQTAVLVLIDGRRLGVSLTAGCSIGPLLSVFLVAAAPFVWYRRFSLQRLAASIVVLAVVLVVANQIRIAVIVASMRKWGFVEGYQISHVFFGSAITTVGFVAGVVVFIRLFASKPAVTS